MSKDQDEFFLALARRIYLRDGRYRLRREKQMFDRVMTNAESKLAKKEATK